MKLGVVVTSRNCYSFMEKFFVKRMPDGVEILNIDEESSDKQKKQGRELCKKHGIVYQDCDVRGMQHNMRQACKYFRCLGKKFVIYFQHDCWPMTPDFFERLDRLICSGQLDAFGSLGFNALATDSANNYSVQRPQFEAGKKPIGVLARSPLDRHAPWYTGYSRKKLRALSHPELFSMPFSAEVPAWFAAGLNIELFAKHILPCSDYQFFHAWDDLCFQFLQQNIHNLILPSFYIEHRPDLKPLAGLPKKSVSLAKHGDETYHGHFRHAEVWERRWGWNYERRGTFREVEDRYQGTLIERFYQHDSDLGPLETFEVTEDAAS